VRSVKENTAMKRMKAVTGHQAKLFYYKQKLQKLTPFLTTKLKHFLKTSLLVYAIYMVQITLYSFINKQWYNGTEK